MIIKLFDTEIIPDIFFFFFLWEIKQFEEKSVYDKKQHPIKIQHK